MDQERIFRAIVAGDYIPELDYNIHCFRFKTIFVLTPNSYLCCMCAYEHEYLEYITHTGKLDNDLFEKILKCIETGQCPHVAGAPERAIAETKLRSLNIAAAIGTLQPFGERTFNAFQGNIATGIFRVHVCEMALWKGSKEILKVLENNLKFVGDRLFAQPVSIQRECSTSSILIVKQQIHTGNLMAFKYNKLLFERSLSQRRVSLISVKMLEYTFQNNLSDVRDGKVKLA